MPLLAARYFDLLFDGMEGKSIGFLSLEGNAGDLMIQHSTRELFDVFGVKYRDITESELASGLLTDPIDEIVVSGGGNMGTLWPVPFNQRRRALEFGLPVTIFSQSFTRNDEDTRPYKRVFVRELASKEFCRDFILAPDMALGMAVPDTFDPPVAETGLFLRIDRESSVIHNPIALIDPICISKTIDEYLALASMFEHIITDRLHFAIAGLMVGRDVTLLPNGYHKNRSMYETWLEGLGCNWLENTDLISYDREQVEQHLWKRLAGVPSEIFDWSLKPVASKESRTDVTIDIEEYIATCESYDQFDPGGPGILESLFDGNRTIEDMVMLITSSFPDCLASAAMDLQAALKANVESSLRCFVI